jgi:lysophospholipase L1-like esterase
MSERSAALRAHFPLLAVLVASQAAFGLALSRCLAAGGTLAGSGHWVSTKATLARPVMGAQSFLRGRQAVERRRLNLGAWFGYQEVLYHRPVAAREIEYELLLYPEAYACLVFDVTERGFAGARLSLSERFPSQFFTASSIGEFTSRAPLSPPALRPRDWSRVRAVFARDGLTLHVDGREAGRFRLPLTREQVFGFRGGRRISLVRDVVVRPEGADPLRPGFTRHESLLGLGAWGRAALAFLAVVAANGWAYRVARRVWPARPARSLALGTILTNGVGTALALLLLAYFALTAARYPALDRALRASEREWREATAEDVRREIRRRYGAPAPPGTKRVLFLGSSQTWGAGAARPGQSLVEVTERLLNESAAAPRQCINGGISAGDSTLLLELLEKEWLALRPDVLVVNLGNNDADPALLAAHVERMARLALAARATPVLVLEPNTTEDPAGEQNILRANHDALRGVGARLGLGVVDMHDHLAGLADRGFLFWDSVHLTSFGQRLFAERLAPELERILEPGAPGGARPVDRRTRHPALRVGYVKVILSP